MGTVWYTRKNLDQNLVSLAPFGNEVILYKFLFFLKNHQLFHTGLSSLTIEKTKYHHEIKKTLLDIAQNNLKHLKPKPTLIGCGFPGG